MVLQEAVAVLEPSRHGDILHHSVSRQLRYCFS